MPKLTRTHNKMVETLSLLKELIDGFSYEESKTTNMSELEGNEYAEQQGQGLKLLTPNQMLRDYQFLQPN